MADNSAQYRVPAKFIPTIDRCLTWLRSGIPEALRGNLTRSDAIHYLLDCGIQAWMAEHPEQETE